MKDRLKNLKKKYFLINENFYKNHNGLIDETS